MAATATTMNALKTLVVGALVASDFCSAAGLGPFEAGLVLLAADPPLVVAEESPLLAFEVTLVWVAAEPSPVIVAAAPRFVVSASVPFVYVPSLMFP